MVVPPSESKPKKEINDHWSPDCQVLKNQLKNNSNDHQLIPFILISKLEYINNQNVNK